MEDVTSKPKAEEISTGGGILSELFSIFLIVSIIATALWNWDGFWQTDINFLKNSQKDFFSAKYNEEQLKLSRISTNNDVLEEIENRLKAYEIESKMKIDKYRLVKDNAILEAERAKLALSEYVDQENLKCRYLDTSRRMIEHLTKKYSADELGRTLSCTSIECENILYAKPEAASICG